MMNRRKALHAAGTLMISSIISSMTALSGCRKATRAPQISSLSSNHAKAMVSEIAEIIIPETDTSGAGSAQTDRFILKAIYDCSPPEDIGALIDGLNELERECASRYGKLFLDCSKSQRASLIEEIDKEAFGLWSKIKAKLFHRTHYFKNFKRLALIGYFTSKPGSTQNLAYVPIPGSWENCQEIKPGQKSWATE
jgi:hypothetical protein